MKAFATYACLLCLIATTCKTARAQAAVGDPAPKSEITQLELLTKKIDEQNAKIDALSQQLLKIEQQLAKPGVMIGGSTSTPVSTPAPVIDSVHGGPNSHTVSRGETLTSIAKMHKVGVEELQKFNHIENDRKLQIGQIIQIPVSSAAAAPSASPTPSPATGGD